MRVDVFKNNPVLNQSFEFALAIIRYCEQLEERKRFVVANQLLKSGTSIGANVMEAQNSESKADFIHKMKIAAKEAEETQYWLLLCRHSERYPSCDDLMQKLEGINKLLGKILSTAKGKHITAG